MVELDFDLKNEPLIQYLRVCVRGRGGKCGKKHPSRKSSNVIKMSFHDNAKLVLYILGEQSRR